MVRLVLRNKQPSYESICTSHLIPAPNLQTITSFLLEVADDLT